MFLGMINRIGELKEEREQAEKARAAELEAREQAEQTQTAEKEANERVLAAERGAKEAQSARDQLAMASSTPLPISKELAVDTTSTPASSHTHLEVKNLTGIINVDGDNVKLVTDDGAYVLKCRDSATLDEYKGQAGQNIVIKGMIRDRDGVKFLYISRIHSLPLPVSRELAADPTSTPASSHVHPEVKSLAGIINVDGDNVKLVTDDGVYVLKCRNSMTLDEYKGQVGQNVVIKGMIRDRDGVKSLYISRIHSLSQ